MKGRLRTPCSIIYGSIRIPLNYLSLYKKSVKVSTSISPRCASFHISAKWPLTLNDSSLLTVDYERQFRTVPVGHSNDIYIVSCMVVDLYLITLRMESTRSLSFPGITWSSCRKRRTVAADREPVCSMDEYDPRHRHLTPLISRKQARWYDQY